MSAIKLKSTLGSVQLTPENATGEGVLTVPSTTDTVMVRGDEEVNVRHYWRDTDTTWLRAIQEAVDSGRPVYIPEGTYDGVQGLVVPDGARIRGVGYMTALESGETLTAPMFIVSDVSSVTISDMRFSSGSIGNHGQVEIRGISSGIRIKDSFFEGAYSGVWINPTGNTDIIKNVTIEGNTFDGNNHPVYVGANTDAVTTETILNVSILSNTFINNLGDGVKTVKRCSNLIISNNTFDGNSGDAVDLFVSGERVIVSNNIMRNNALKAVDIKAHETNYPVAEWGNAHSITVSNNIMDSNGSSGIAVQMTIPGEITYGVIISNNVITNNFRKGVDIESHYVTVTDNFIAWNCTDITHAYNAIEIIGQDATDEAGDIMIQGNTVLNNGNVSLGNKTAGISVTSNVNGVQILNNLVRNDASVTGSGHQDFGIKIGYDNGVDAIVDDNISQIVVKGNSVLGHTTDVYVSIYADTVSGETTTVRIGDIDAASLLEVPILFGHLESLLLTSAYLISGTDVVQSDTDYNLMLLRNRGNDGTGTGTIGSVSTEDYTLSSFVARKLGPFNNTRSSILVSDVVTFYKTQGGTGKDMSNVAVTVNYIKY